MRLHVDDELDLLLAARQNSAEADVVIDDPFRQGTAFCVEPVELQQLFLIGSQGNRADLGCILNTFRSYIVNRFILELLDASLENVGQDISIGEHVLADRIVCSLALFR